MNAEPWGAYGRRWRWIASIPPGSAALPWTPPEPRQPSDDEEKAAGDAPASQAQEIIVLVAEDEEAIAETLALIVEDSGYVALIAQDGRTALALARQHRPRLIITDLMMPRLSGAELVAAVRADAATEGNMAPSVVIVTAANLALADEVGADAVITKPFDVQNIEAVMRRLLEGDDNH